MSGTLFIVATPIGNLEDITLRALRVLKEADLIACEDTRHTRKLLSHYQIRKPTISYHEHNELERSAELVKKLEAGMNIAVVSDGGTPLVSDPGFRIVREAIDRRIPVVPIPGPSAVIAAVSASALPSGEFTFFGFLPARRAARRARLAELAEIKTTLVFYEAPHRIRDTLADAHQVLGDRECVVARELTKLHEEFVRGRLSHLDLPEIARGEIVLLIGPPDKSRQPDDERAPSINEEIERLKSAEGLDQKDALKRIARERGIGKSEAYRLMLAERGRST